MREELEEAYTYKEQRFSKKHFYMACGALLLGMFLYYLCTLLWGVNSYKVYQTLKAEKKSLQKEVGELESKNVELQKIIFELKGLEPAKEESK